MQSTTPNSLGASFKPGRTTPKKSELPKPGKIDDEQAVFIARIKEPTKPPKKQPSVHLKMEADSLSYTINKIRHTAKPTTIPYLLLWVRSIGPIYLEIIGPEQIIILVCEDAVQKNSWKDALLFRIKKALERSQAGDYLIRANSYVFVLNPKTWEYDGDWRDGNMFGTGRLSLRSGNTAQTTYIGYFHFPLGLGLGVKETSKGNKVTKNIGWAFSSPFDGHIISEFHHKEISGLTLDDYDEIKRKSQIKSVEKGTQILVAGSQDDEYLYLIKSGGMRLTKKRVAFELAPGDLFGSLLTAYENINTYDVKAVENSELYVIRFATLEKDFDESFLLRLSFQISTILGNRWQEICPFRSSLLQRKDAVTRFTPLGLHSEGDQKKNGTSDSLVLASPGGSTFDIKSPKDNSIEHQPLKSPESTRRVLKRKGTDPFRALDQDIKDTLREIDDFVLKSTTAKDSGSLELLHRPSRSPETKRKELKSRSLPRDRKGKEIRHLGHTRKPSGDNISFHSIQTVKKSSPENNSEESTTSGATSTTSTPEEVKKEVEKNSPSEDEDQLNPVSREQSNNVSVPNPPVRDEERGGSSPGGWKVPGFSLNDNDSSATTPESSPEISHRDISNNSENGDFILKRRSRGSGSKSGGSPNIKRAAQPPLPAIPQIQLQWTVPIEIQNSDAPRVRVGMRRNNAAVSQHVSDPGVGSPKIGPKRESIEEDETIVRSTSAPEVVAQKRMISPRKVKTKEESSSSPTTPIPLARNEDPQPPQPPQTQSPPVLQRRSKSGKMKREKELQPSRLTVEVDGTEDDLSPRASTHLFQSMKAVKRVLVNTTPSLSSPKNQKENMVMRSSLDETVQSLSAQEKYKTLMQLFKLDENTVVLHQYHTLGSTKIGNSKTEFWGILYLTNKHIAFVPQNIDSSVLVPLSVLEETIKHKHTKVSFTINPKNTHDVMIPNRAPGIIGIRFSFNSPEQAEQVFEILQYIISSKTTQLIDSSEANLNHGEVFQYFTDRYQMIETDIETIPLSKSIGKCLRFSGPGFNSEQLQSQQGLFTWDLGNNSPLGITVTTTYPRIFDMVDGKLGVRDDLRIGDPICDQYALEVRSNQIIFAIADGCNWGKKVAKAAQCASRTFVEVISQSLRAGSVRTTTDTFPFFLDAFAQAHSSIVMGEQSWSDCGTTTLLGGLLSPVHHPVHKWALMLMNLGDCKAYRIQTTNSDFIVSDMTPGSRFASNFNSTDCGGRLGSTNDDNLPDLRNLSVNNSYVDEGDFVFCCSDGIYDNLDPQSLAISFEELGIPDIKGWDSIPNDSEVIKSVQEAKQKFILNKIKRILMEVVDKSKKPIAEITPTDMRDALVAYTVEVTKKCREWMEADYKHTQPVQSKEFPGKPDHVTCIVWRISSSQQVISQQEELFSQTMKKLNDPIKGINQSESHLVSGQDLLTWLEQNPQDQCLNFNSLEIAQRLVDLNFINPVSQTNGTFYNNQMYCLESENIMTHMDWQMFDLGIYRISCWKRKDLVVTRSEDKKPKVWRLRKGKCKLLYANGETKRCHAPETFVTFGKLIGNDMVIQAVVGDSDDVEIAEFHPQFLELVFYKHPEVGKRFYRFISLVLARCTAQLIDFDFKMDF